MNMKILFFNALFNTLRAVICVLHSLLESYQFEIGIPRKLAMFFEPISFLCFASPMYFYLLKEFYLNFFQLF